MLSSPSKISDPAGNGVLPFPSNPDRQTGRQTVHTSWVSAVGHTSCSAGHSLDKPSSPWAPGRCRVPVPHAWARGPQRLVLALTAIANVTVIATLGSDGAVHMQLAQTFSPGSVLGAAVGCGFQNNCSPSPLCLQAEVGADPRSQAASREPPNCKPCSRASRLQTLLRRKQPSPLPDPPAGRHPSKALLGVLRSPEPVRSPKASPLSPCVTEPAL